MPTAITPLANITLSSSVNSVTFSSINGTYRDLFLVVNAVPNANTNMHLEFNSDTGNNYNWVRMSGNGTSATSSSGSNTITQFNWATSMRSTTRNSYLFHILDYSATDKHKTVLSRTDIDVAGTETFCNRWANTSAITAVKVLVDATETFVSGTTMSLYGVSA